MREQTNPGESIARHRDAGIETGAFSPELAQFAPAGPCAHTGLGHRNGRLRVPAREAVPHHPLGAHVTILRDVLGAVHDELGAFTMNNLRPRAPFGLVRNGNAPVKIEPLVESLSRAREILETIYASEGDATPVTISVRSVASGALAVVESALIDLVPRTNNGGLTDGELREVLDHLSAMRGGLREISVQFDAYLAQTMAEAAARRNGRNVA